MSYKQRFSNILPSKGFQLTLQPVSAWTAIIGLIIFTLLLILLGAGKILNFAFPVGAFVVGIFLYFRYPILYVGFTWWTLFLTPLVRRLADYRSSFTDPSPILLAPYLVLLITLVTLWQNLPKAYRRDGLPFILAILGLFYSFMIGLINLPAITVVIALLEWLAPVIFGFHLFTNWRNYPSYRQNIQRTFLWGVLVMGLYGILQYLVAPEWDRFWLINGSGVSFGSPEALGIRVWSTLNSPGPFAVVMMAGLLLLLNGKGNLRISAMVAGYFSFLLSLVRSAWGGWFVGFLTLFSSLKANLQIRLISVVLIMVLLVIPLTTIEPFSETINNRIESLSNIEDDGSAKARKRLYEEKITPALTSFVGQGIGTKRYDSAILNMLLHLGWLGTIPYMSGMILLIFRLFQASKISRDPFISNANAISLAVFSQLIFGSPMLGIMGVVLWGFLGIGLAGHKYYQYQNTIRIKEG